jgi:hypothetical protein
MSTNELQTLLDMAESMLATAEKLPLGPDRRDALQTIRKFAIEITRHMDRRRLAELGLKAKSSE